MASPLDDQQVSNLSSSIHQQILSQFQGEWVTRLNVDQMLVLIDGILPFEACLYYQVLPLFLEGNRLHLGMVSPDDTAASEYVRRIVSYLNYSLVSQPISSEALRVVLTAYLNFVGSQQAKGTQRESFSVGHYRHSSRVKAQQTDANERLTLVVDSPEDLYTTEASQSGLISGAVTAPPPTEEVPPTAPPTAFEEEPQQFTDLTDLADLGVMQDQSQPVLEQSHAERQSQPRQPSPNLVNQDHPVPLVTPNPVKPNSTEASPTAENLLEPTSFALTPHTAGETPVVHPIRWGITSNKPLTILQVETKYLTSPVEVLAALPPRELLQELLARVLLGGIGRLYFERYPQGGRVVWSQNGILQSVLDHVALPVFQGVIHALKEIACVSQLPVEQPEQTEIEYLYDRSCVLLRFRFMPGQHGEEATVQVLRGAALKFYQQQQLSKLERDAMSIAKQLQNKLNEIRIRAYADPSLLETNLEILPKLSELLHTIEQQLNALRIGPTE